MPCKWVDDCEGRPCHETEHDCRCNCEYGGLDPNSKECRCKNFATCLPPRRLEDDCSCDCPDGQVWNGKTCIEDCPPGQRRNRATGQCEDVHCWRPKADNCGCEPAVGVSPADCLAQGYKATQQLCEEDHPPCEPPPEKCFRCDDPATSKCVEIDNPNPGTPCTDQGLYDFEGHCETNCAPPRVNISCWFCDQDQGKCAKRNVLAPEGSTCADVGGHATEADCKANDCHFLSCYECSGTDCVEKVSLGPPARTCFDLGQYETLERCEATEPECHKIPCWDCVGDHCEEVRFNVPIGTTCFQNKKHANEAACRQYGHCGPGGGTTPPDGGGGGAPVACTPPFPPPMGQPLFCQDGTQYGLTTYRVDIATCQWVEERFIFGDCAGNGGTGGVAPPADGGGVPGAGCTPPVPPPDEREMVCGLMVPKLRGAVVECWATYTEYDWCTECSPTGMPLLKGVKTFSTDAKGGEFHPWATNSTAPDLACPGDAGSGGGGDGGGSGSAGPDSSSNGSDAADPADPQLEARAVHIPGKSGGAGTELKALLALVGITSTPTCKCNARAKEMDVRGIKWVEENRPTVLSWLKEEAERRKLPFFPAAGRMLIKRAIENAKRKGFK